MVVIAFIAIFSHVQSLMLSLAYTIPVAVVFDIICCIIEYLVDKTFEGIEKLRRYNYDKKVENIEAVNKEIAKERRGKKKMKKNFTKTLKTLKTYLPIFQASI